jgi:hypothetical protein
VTVHTGVEVSGFVDPQTRRRLVRVRLGGWTVHIDGRAVTVPRQTLTGKSIDDLQACLAAAYSRADIELTRQAPAYDPAQAGALARTLAVARQITKTHWRRQSHDIYHCTSDAWRHCGMVVPYASLIGVLRDALPSDTTLTEYNDSASGGSQIRLLYTRAMGQVAARARQGVA